MGRALAGLTLAAVIAGCTPPPAVSGTPTPSTTEAPSAASTPTAATPLGTARENLILGYRIVLPASYRLASTNVPSVPSEVLGNDVYTTQTEADAKAACLVDIGDVPPPSTVSFFTVTVYRNAQGTSAEDWGKRPEFALHTVVPTTLNGLEAAKLVQQNETRMYLIRSNDRMYLLLPQMWPSTVPLDAIATTFRAMTPTAAPSPTPTVPPSTATQTLATALARAFAAKDVDAIAALVSDCQMGVTALIASLPGPLASQPTGLLNRSVPMFLDGLRARFAAGDLRVIVETSPQVTSDLGGEHYVVRSQWIEPDRTTSIDLGLAESGGRWLWMGALHHYPTFGPGNCIPYRSPWVSPAVGTC